MLASAERWRLAIDAVRGQSARHGASLAFGRVVSVKPGEVTLYFPPEQGFHRTTVSAPSGRAIVERALSEHYRQPTRLVFSETAPAGAPMVSVAEADAKDRVAREKSAEGQMRSHPSVRAVLKILGGEIEHIRVIEKERPPAGPVEAPDDGA